MGTYKKEKLVWASLFIVARFLWANWLGWFNSVEDNLTDGTWYASGYDEYTGSVALTLRFRSNGVVERCEYTKSSGGSGWYCADRDRWKWEILDDNTLYVDGSYYEWKEERAVNPLGLTFEQNNYTRNDEYGIDSEKDE